MNWDRIQKAFDALIPSKIASGRLPSDVCLVLRLRSSPTESSVVFCFPCSIFLGVTPSGTPAGVKPPPNPGKAVCDATPKDMCTSGCPPGARGFDLHFRLLALAA